MRHLLLTASLLAVAVDAAASTVTATEEWTIPASAPCAGFTVGWTPPLAHLQTLVGAGAMPAPGPVKGHGLLMVFVTHCPGSRIGGDESGPLTLAAVIIPLASADVPGIDSSKAGHAAAMPLIRARGDAPVARLFARHAFTVEAADVSLQVTDIKNGKHAAFTIRTAKGSMQAQADFAAPSESRDIPVSLLTNAGSRQIGVVTGPESSTRYTTPSATVSATGANPLSRYGIEGAPAMAALDTGFTWDFRFLPVRATR